LAISCYNDLQTLFLAVPEHREKEVIFQLKRPSIQQHNILIKYILFSDLRQHCDAICKFGEDHTVMKKISKLA